MSDAQDSSGFSTRHQEKPITRSQRALLLGAVFLLSRTMLGFEILQVTVLSLQLFPEAAFLVASLSMLGIGTRSARADSGLTGVWMVNA